MGLQDFLQNVLGGIEEQIRAQQQDQKQVYEQERRHQQQRESRPAVEQAQREPESGIGSVMRAVVQVVALRQTFLGGMSSAWTGSGTVVHPSGIILTNCHVADPRAMGMSSPPADRLGIAVIERSDQPPAISYFAQVVAKSPRLDLAVLRIVADVKGRKTKSLDLPYADIGDSDDLKLGDRLAIFGYPGIGGETVTFTSGHVSGFTAEEGVPGPRAWIKTDATIAGGNSGGTSVNQQGQLVGIPTQAAAGSGVTPVDARPVLDTNRDGRIDQRDTPMAVGGFINGLRPVNLAIGLLEQAGMKIERDRRSQRRERPSVLPDQSIFNSRREEAGFRELLFSTGITDDGRPINPTTHVPVGIPTVYATFEHFDVKRGTPWSVVWMANGEVIIDQKEDWDDAEDGRKVVKVSNRRGLPEGEYHLVLGIGKSVALEGKVLVGTPIDETDAELSGKLVDGRTGRGIAGGLVIVLKPGAPVLEFLRSQDQGSVVTSTETGSDGSFTFPQQLPKGQAYGLVAAARGYQHVAVEGALRVGPGAPERADIGAIELKPS